MLNVQLIKYIITITIVILLIYYVINTAQWVSLRKREEKDSLVFKQNCDLLEQCSQLDIYRNTEYIQGSPIYTYLQLSQYFENSKRVTKGNILFILGMLQSIEDAKYIFNELAHLGYNIIVASRRQNTYNIDEYIQDYLYIWNKYTTQFQNHKTKNKLQNIIIGHSLGGLISTRLVQQHPHIFQQLILICPFLSFRPSVSNLLYETLVRRGFKTIKQLVNKTNDCKLQQNQLNIDIYRRKSENVIDDFSIQQQQLDQYNQQYVSDQITELDTPKEQYQKSKCPKEMKNIQLSKNNILPLKAAPHILKIQQDVMKNAKSINCRILLIQSDCEHLVGNYEPILLLKNNGNPLNRMSKHKDTSHYFAKSKKSFSQLINDFQQFQYI